MIGNKIKGRRRTKIENNKNENYNVSIYNCIATIKLPTQHIYLMTLLWSRLRSQRSVRDTEIRLSGPIKMVAISLDHTHQMF